MLDNPHKSRIGNASALTRHVPGTSGKTPANRKGLKVKTALKATGIGYHQHNRRALKVRTSVKAGGWPPGNHSRRVMGVGRG